MNIKKYSTFENWIPSVDIDEIDANKNYVRDIINGDFHNGFISNATEPLEIALPSAIQSLITAGWELLLYKYFYHSTQGDIYISVLYKSIATVHTLKFYVNSTELLLDEQNEDMVVASKPTNISYCLTENQFKVNLNVNGTTASLTKTVILNVTFVYLTHRVYIPTDHERAEGWYVFPRWLSWTLEESDSSIEYAIENTNEFLETCNDDTYETHFNVEANFVWGTPPTLPAFTVEAGALGFYNSSDTLGLFGWLSVDSLKQVKTVKFQWGSGEMGDTGNVHLLVGFTNNSFAGSFSPNEEESWVEVFSQIYTVETHDELIKFEQDVNMMIGSNDKITDTSFKLWIGIGLPARPIPDNDPYCNIRNIELIPFEAVVVSKNEDKQRNIIKDKFNIGLFDDPVLSIPIANIDWRIQNYELYLNRNDVYILYKEAVVEDSNWTEVTTNLEGTFSIVEDFPDVITTLNFNYGLGVTVRVNNQKLIYSEASYRNRNYFVKNDSKLYYSHISGTGLAQPDSFPYSEENLFGYLITDNSAINKAVCITALDEVLILTDKNDYVYTIENSSGIPFRKVKAINGSMGILSIKSLITDFSGSQLAKVLIWSDNWAIYGYAGGREIPQSITGISHKNYWQAVSGKETAIGIYNKATNEYWVQTDEHIMIYEIDTNTWKKYVLTYKIKDFVGIINDYTYILGSNNKVYMLNPASENKLEATVELHDDICLTSEQGSEVQQKILQDLFILFKDAEISEGVNAIISLYVEDYNYNLGEILIPMNYKSYITRTPLNVQYSRLRIKIVLPVTSTNAKLKEIGYWFTESGVAYGDTQNIVEGVGQESGHEIGVFG